MGGVIGAIRSRLDAVPADKRAAIASWSRLTIFIVLALWIAGGPAYKQLLGGKTKLIRPWIMFNGKAIGAVAARFETVDRKGRRKPLDHYELFGETRPFSFDERADKSLSMVRGPPHFRNLVRKICRKLGRRADLRATAYISRRKGWKELEDGERNLCARKGRQRPKDEPRPKERKRGR